MQRLFAHLRAAQAFFCSRTYCSIDSTIFNAVLCALLHAGIPLHRSFVSATVAMCDGAWVIDPLASEEVGLCSARDVFAR